MTFSLELVLIAAVVLIIIFIALLIRLEIKIARILRGKDAKNLEDTIVGLTKEIDALAETQTKTGEYLETVERRLSRSIQGIETLRFNPFKGTGTGGNQSFATAFLDERGSGVVISTLHSRERVSVFAKPIVNKKSEYELTSEEKQVVALLSDRVKERSA